MKMNPVSALAAALLALSLVQGFSQTTTTNINFESSQGFNIGDYGNTLKTDYPGIFTQATVPDSAEIVAANIGGVGWQVLKMSKSDDYIEILASVPSNAQRFTISLQLRPGSAWSAPLQLGFGIDAQAIFYHCTSTGAKLSTEGYVSFSGNGNSASLQTVSAGLTWPLTNTTIPYIYTKTYDVSMTIDFVLNKTILEVTQGGALIYSKTDTSTFTGAGDYFLLTLRGGTGNGYGDGTGILPVYDNIRMWMDQPVDFNGDQKSDIVLQNSVTRAARIWYMNGASRIGGVNIGTPSANTEVAGIGDFNGDQQSDIVLHNTVTRAATVWYMNGATQTGSAGMGFIPADFKIVAIADFNSDGKPDLVLYNSVTGAGRIWFMDGRIRTGGVSLGAIPTGFRIATAGDFNGDGKPDLMLENTVTGARRIWFMDGSVHTGGASIGVISTDWSFVGSGDFNYDGKADLILQNSVTGAGRFWYMDGATRTGSAGLPVPTDWQIRN